MRLTKLELNGFKSFARKTEICFGDGIAAIIGPNGSGKSNIADAVRWALGEQSAKALRGAKMEDVIFSGTQLRKAQAYCEVSLTFDNTDGKLAVPFAEVAVTRRVYRSGESEYCINKNPCRLRDIQEMFRDTGVGKDGYSIIGQGKVDEILANKSGDRRAALEEAAGVMRYRVRKEEAERKLDNTEKNLVRIGDILRELGERLAPLEEQSAAARAYLKLRDELKDLEINLFLYQFERLNERLSASNETIAQLQTEAVQTQARQDELLESCASLEERLHALDAALSEEQNKLMGMLSGVESELGESRVLDERCEHAAQTLARIESEQLRAKERLDELERTIEKLKRDEAGSAAIDLLDADIASTHARLIALDTDVSEREEALETLKNGIIEAMNRISDARSSLSRFDAMQAALHERAEALLSESGRQSDETKRLFEERAAAEAAEREQAAALIQARADLDGAIRTRGELSDAYAALREQAQKDEQTLSSLQSRLRLLEEMAKSHEGYFASVKNIMRDAERDARLSQAIVGVVAELMRVPKAYETAVSMALGSAMQNIVTPTAEDAQHVIEYLRAHDYGRATLLPLALLRPTQFTREERALFNVDGCIGVASELVECDERAMGAVQHLLGRTLIVRDLNAGIALKKRARSGFQIATLEGDIISAGGSMSGGSAQKKGLSLLGREREIQELRARIGELEKTLVKRREEVRQKEREMLQSDVQVDAFREALHVCEMEAAKRGEQREIILRDEEKSREKETALGLERARLEENLADIERQRAEAERVQSDLSQGNDATREDVTRAQAALAGARGMREAAAAELTEEKVRRMALAKERDAVLTEQKRLVAEHKSLCERNAALQREREETEAARMQIQEQRARIQERIQSAQQSTEQERETQKKIEDERQRTSEALSEQRARREELLTLSRDLTERIHRQELGKSRMELELEAMQDHVWEEYELTYENATPFRREIAVGATNTRVAEIKNEIKSLGDVNLSSIDDFKSVSERHTALSAQFEDLTRAKEDLEALIVELTQTMQTVFLRQFEEIRKNFTQVFSELFGGGTAELRLADKNDALNCEIDIIAQPPGKKLQLLSLLSGGERALTAIALLFAMLKLKPPAFCLLDEIESSLDEANVSRFAEYVRDYREGTQFILITHRKGSMEVCDTLYGVSMQEKGVSKVVSARFGEGA